MSTSNTILATAPRAANNAGVALAAAQAPAQSPSPSSSTHPVLSQRAGFDHSAGATKATDSQGRLARAERLHRRDLHRNSRPTCASHWAPRRLHRAVYGAYDVPGRHTDPRSHRSGAGDSGILNATIGNICRRCRRCWISRFRRFAAAALTPPYRSTGRCMRAARADAACGKAVPWTMTNQQSVSHRQSFTQTIGSFADLSAAIDASANRAKASAVAAPTAPSPPAIQRRDGATYGPTPIRPRRRSSSFRPLPQCSGMGLTSGNGLCRHGELRPGQHGKPEAAGGFCSADHHAQRHLGRHHERQRHLEHDQPADGRRQCLDRREYPAMDACRDRLSQRPRGSYRRRASGRSTARWIAGLKPR